MVSSEVLKKEVSRSEVSCNLHDEGCVTICDEVTFLPL